MQNVKVAVRCRPLSSKEIARGCTEIVKITNNNIVINTPGDVSHEGAHNYTFDHCYYTDSTQVQVFKDLGEPMLMKALDGFNGTLFAYGQTGSGKSFSMMGSYVDGDELNKGIIPRLNTDLWAKCQDKLGPINDNNNTKILVSISFLEIYNENIKDLLNPNDKIQLKIRESPEQGIYVEGLCELIVKDAASINRLIDQGNTVRRVAATNMNEQSSRSHSVFTIKIEQKTITELEGGVTREQIVKAKLNLVDLAGSERANKTGATGSTLKEGANINMSLMALGNVINALSETAASKGQKRHIPYRDSKLTRLLQESLGGNSATVMLAAISPADYNYDETLSTLKYAHRAKSIENVVVRNEDMQERMIRDLKNEIENLKKQLQGGGGGVVDQEAERKLKELQEAQKSAWEEREQLSKQLEEERQSNMNTVISNMMTTVKDQKVNIMKNIKRLTNEKASITKKMKANKDSNDSLRSKLDELMVEYQTQQGQYDNLVDQKDDESSALLETIGNKMASLLASIEASKNEWVKRREELKALKENLDVIEEEITSERGELVATAGLLDQNDKLRAQIVEEERSKAKELIEQEVAKARALLDIEKSALEGDLETKHSEKILELKETIKLLEMKVENLQHSNNDVMSKSKTLQQYIDDIESRMTDAEVSLETLTAENTTLNEEIQKYKNNEVSQEAVIKSLQEKMEQMERQHNEQLQIEQDKRENDKIKVFEILVTKFNEDSDNLVSKYKDNQRLLASATSDIMQLIQENRNLKCSLEQSLAFERRIHK